MANTNAIYRIFTNDGKTHDVEAPSLRTALRNFGGPADSILAAVRTDCLPSPNAETGPFMAVLLLNPAFTPPPLE